MKEDKTKIVVTLAAVFASINGWLGIMATPVWLLMACNIMDYMTGLLAAPHRSQKISSYQSIRGIKKKIGQWILVFVGVMVDVLLKYITAQTIFHVDIKFIFGSAVAVWLIVNELISIAENVRDMDVKIPPFVVAFLKKMKKEVEEKTKVEDKNNE